MGGRAPGSRDPDTCVSGCELSRVYDLTFKSRPEPTGEMAAGVPAGTWRYVESSVGAKRQMSTHKVELDGSSPIRLTLEISGWGTGRFSFEERPLLVVLPPFGIPHVKTCGSR